MNPFRILKRFRDLELRVELVERVQDDQREKVRRLDAIDPTAIAEEHVDKHAAKSLPCGRCGGMMDVAFDREHGPRIVENGKQRAIVCAWCRAALKPRGWTLAKLELPAEPVEPAPAPDPAQTEEATA